MSSNKLCQEFKACAISQVGQIPTQSCFDANPLKFISDVNFGAPADPLYPTRAYIPLANAGGTAAGTWKYEYKFKLPSNLSGDHVVFQWHYITANSCMHVGYDTYNWPVSAIWPVHPSLDAGKVPWCGPLPADGQGVPEQFWNCADIKIAKNCASNPPPPSTPTSNPPPTRAPLNSSIPTVIPPTLPLSPSTCSAIMGSCGPNMSCPVGLCCSQWGFCGIDEIYCGSCCQSGPCLHTTTPPPSKPTMYPTSSKPRTSIPSKLLSVKPTMYPTSSKPRTSIPSKPSSVKPTLETAVTSKPISVVTQKPTTSNIVWTCGNGIVAMAFVPIKIYVAVNGGGVGQLMPTVKTNFNYYKV